MAVLLSMKTYVEYLRFLCVLLVLPSTADNLHNSFCKV